MELSCLSVCRKTGFLIAACLVAFGFFQGCVATPGTRKMSERDAKRSAPVACETVMTGDLHVYRDFSVMTASLPVSPPGTFFLLPFGSDVISLNDGTGSLSTWTLMSVTSERIPVDAWSRLPDPGYGSRSLLSLPSGSRSGKVTARVTFDTVKWNTSLTVVKNGSGLVDVDRYFCVECDQGAPSGRTRIAIESDGGTSAVDLGEAVLAPNARLFFKRDGRKGLEHDYVFEWDTKNERNSVHGYISFADTFSLGSEPEGTDIGYRLFEGERFLNGGKAGCRTENGTHVLVPVGRSSFLSGSREADVVERPGDALRPFTHKTRLVVKNSSNADRVVRVVHPLAIGEKAKSVYRYALAPQAASGGFLYWNLPVPAKGEGVIAFEFDIDLKICPGELGYESFGDEGAR